MREKEARNPQETIDLIERLAHEKRFNPSSFAKALGYTRPWGYSFMKNEIVITLSLLKRIAKLLEVPVTSLVAEGEESMPEKNKQLPGQGFKSVDLLLGGKKVGMLLVPPELEVNIRVGCWPKQNEGDE
ncbi:MAG: hypothetical protein ABFD52_09065 [Acidobacteriota bacterium]